MRPPSVDFLITASCPGMTTLILFRVDPPCFWFMVERLWLELEGLSSSRLSSADSFMFNYWPEESNLASTLYRLLYRTVFRTFLIGAIERNRFSSSDMFSRLTEDYYWNGRVGCKEADRVLKEFEPLGDPILLWACCYYYCWICACLYSIEGL